MRKQAQQEAAIYAHDKRPLLTWDVIQLEKAAPTWLWTPSAEDNAATSLHKETMAACYFGPEALIHPYFLLDTCNRALMRLTYSRMDSCWHCRHASCNQDK